MIPGQVKYPGLIQVTGFYQLLADFHPVGYRTGYAVHKADRTSQCTVVDITGGAAAQSRKPSFTNCSRMRVQSATGRFTPSTNRIGQPRLLSSM